MHDMHVVPWRRTCEVWCFVAGSKGATRGGGGGGGGGWKSPSDTADDGFIIKGYLWTGNHVLPSESRGHPKHGNHFIQGGQDNIGKIRIKYRSGTYNTGCE